MILMMLGCTVIIGASARVFVHRVCLLAIVLRHAVGRDRSCTTCFDLIYCPLNRVISWSKVFVCELGTKLPVSTPARLCDAGCDDACRS
jgi:hypothetical protein